MLRLLLPILTHQVIMAGLLLNRSSCGRVAAPPKVSSSLAYNENFLPLIVR